jgi:putative redox protein
VRTDIAVHDESEAASRPNGVAPAGSTPSSSGTAMSVRTFLLRWRIDPGEVTVRVGMHRSVPPMMDRHVTVAAEVGPDLREQLAAVVDSTPVTVLLRDAMTIRTELTTGG